MRGINEVRHMVIPLFVCREEEPCRHRQVPSNEHYIQGNARAVFPRIILLGLYLLVAFWLLFTENRWGSVNSGVLWLLGWPWLLALCFSLRYFSDAFFNATENFQHRKHKHWVREPVGDPLLKALALGVLCAILMVGYVLIFAH